MTHNARQKDLSGWAVVGFNDDTGLGRLAADMRSVLGIGKHLVAPSDRLVSKSLGPGELLLEPSLPREAVRSLLRDLDGIILLERYWWHPELMSLAKELDLPVAALPMWEWFDGKDPRWNDCDLFLCSSQWSYTVVQNSGRSNAVCLPLPIDIERFGARQVSGPARLFIHNAGLVDNDDRKSTRETIRSFKKTRREDISLIVRLQKTCELPAPDSRITIEVANLPNPSDLYKTGDVAVQVSKMEGAGLQIIEAVCSGMPVITLDYPPMNECVRQPEMLVKKRWFKRRAFPTTWFHHAHLRIPDEVDLAQRINWCADHDMEPISTANRKWAVETFDRDKLLTEYGTILGKLQDEKINSRQRNRSVI